MVMLIVLLCAWPDGAVAQQAWLYTPFVSPAWWTRIGFLDGVCGGFGTVAVFFTWSFCLLHVVIVCKKNGHRALCEEKSPLLECLPVGVVILLTFAAGIGAILLASCSGPLGTGISIVLSLLCCASFRPKSRANIRASDSRHLRRAHACTPIACDAQLHRRRLPIQKSSVPFAALDLLLA